MSSMGRGKITKYEMKINWRGSAQLYFATCVAIKIVRNYLALSRRSIQLFKRNLMSIYAIVPTRSNSTINPDPFLHSFIRSFVRSNLFLMIFCACIAISNLLFQNDKSVCFVCFCLLCFLGDVCVRFRTQHTIDRYILFL